MKFGKIDMSDTAFKSFKVLTFILSDGREFQTLITRSLKMRILYGY